MKNWIKNPVKIKFFNSRIKLILFVLLFAGIGGWLVWRSLASGPLIASIQAEQMTLPAGASTVIDSNASGGQAIMLTAPGEASGLLTLPSNATSFSIVAKGTKCKGGRWRKSSSTKNIALSVDGNQLLSTTVSSTSWTIYSGSANLATTNHKVSINYTNSGKSSCSQSLYLDVVNFYGDPAPTPAPTVPFSATPTTVTAGTAVTLTWSTTNATSCTASGTWSGSKALSGSASTGALNNTSTYGLSCTGGGGTTNASVTVTVSAITVVPPAPASMGRFGYSTHILRVGDKATYTDYAVNSNAKTVRDDFSWSAIESTKGSFNWSGPDQIMTYASQRNMDVLAMAGYTPTWARDTVCSSSGDKCPPANVADYANFVAQIARRYGSGGTFWTANPTLAYHPLQAIEIWNEPNITFWLPSPDPVKYTALLKAGYSAIKAANPKIQVISAGLSPYGAYGNITSSRMNPLSYLEKMYQNGATGYMDAVGWHPYNYAAGRTADGMLAYHIASAWSQLSQTTPSVRSLMTANGDSAKKIWATEIGAPTSTNGVTETEQASFATKSIVLWKSYTWAGNYYWYDLREDCTDTTNTECMYGPVRYTNTYKSAYNALKTSYLP